MFYESTLESRFKVKEMSLPSKQFVIGQPFIAPHFGRISPATSFSPNFVTAGRKKFEDSSYPPECATHKLLQIHILTRPEPYLKLWFWQCEYVEARKNSACVHQMNWLSVFHVADNSQL